MMFRSSKLCWGIILLLIAALVLSSQFIDFAHVGVVGIAVIAAALAAIALCVASFKFARLPIPFAALYFVLQAPLGLPFIRLGILILIAFLACLGLGMLFPKWRRLRERRNAEGGTFYGA